MKKIRFFYDFVCPYAYLASLQVDALARETGAELRYSPMLLGGVFRSIGAPDVVPMSDAKAAMNLLDLKRFSAQAGIALRPPANHPLRTLLALRAALASGNVPVASHALFAAYWRDGRNLTEESTVRDVLDAVGLPGAEAVALAATPTWKQALTDHTSEAVAAGVFGAPTFVVEVGDKSELFFGQDRLDFVRRMLGGSPRPPRPEAIPRRKLIFHFDFSSPYAYLASTRVQSLAARAATALEYRPLLLGALFKTIGTPIVPLLTMPLSKQQYNARELDRWSTFCEVPFRFSSHFPVNTVKALRLVLLAPDDKKAPLVDSLFRAVWVDDQDVSKGEVLQAVLQDVGLDVGLLQRTQEDSVKQQLRDATGAALAQGIFGVPTFEVDGELFWGQDRLELVEDALRR